MLSLNRFALCVLVLSAIVALSLRADAAQTLPYTADFEPPVYTLDQTVDGVDGWAAADPTSATVQGAVRYEKQAALALTSGGAVDQAFDSSDAIVWIDGYYRGQPTDEVPDLSELTSGSAIVAFTATSGVLCLDGAGDGSGGEWVPTGIAIDPAKWYRVSLKLDFTTHSYDCYVNGVAITSCQDLGFLYDTTNNLNGFRAATGSSPSYLDYLHVSLADPPGVPGSVQEIVDYLVKRSSPADVRGLDANNDGIIDAADIASRMLDLAAGS